MGDAKLKGLFEGEEGEGPITRRRAIAAAGGAALAAAAGAAAFFAVRASQQKQEPALLAAEVSRKQAAAKGVAYSCPAGDAEGVAAAGASPATIETLSQVPDESALKKLEQEQADEQGGSDGAQSGSGGQGLYVNFSFSELDPGRPYLFTANIMDPTYELVEDLGEYPEGWSFPKWDANGAYRIASARAAGRSSLVVVPSAPSGRVAMAVDLPGEDLYAKTELSAVGAA